ncbi:MAG: ABC transporter ATP-binding protein [Boseongicola sp. SB0662_bin_57]|nr:ABC transporter ATP-binding protein [Boseongicola sp. SB0662_bin_57]
MSAGAPDSSAGSTPLLEVVGLHTHFKTPRGVARAVDGISFRLERGRMLGIVGESGSGKSVLSRTIIDILPHDGSVIYQGRVLFEGRDLRTLSKRKMRDVRGRDIAMVFQDPMSSLNPVMKIGRQITEVLEKRRRLSSADARNQAARLVASVGIPDPEQQLNRYPMHLSGGMRQRVAIAIALAGEPKLLIADEPTTALDVSVQAQIMSLLRRIQKERNMAVIFISHNLGIIAGYADDVAVMYAGQIVECCETQELLNNMRMPYTEVLKDSAPELSARPHSRLAAIPGLPPNLLDVPPGCRFHERCRYARHKCKTEMPTLSAGDSDDGHLYACWYPLKDRRAMA